MKWQVKKIQYMQYQSFVAQYKASKETNKLNIINSEPLIFVLRLGSKFYIDFLIDMRSLTVKWAFTRKMNHSINFFFIFSNNMLKLYEKLH